MSKRRTIHAAKVVLHVTEYAQTSASGTVVTTYFPAVTKVVAPACGAKVRTRRARASDKVTCRNCKRTKVYRRKPKDRRASPPARSPREETK